MHVLDGDFRVGTWRVQPALNRVTGPRGSVQLEPRVMRVFVFLAERAGNVVTRDELLEAVWGDTVVNDDSLTRSISDLRKTLDDDPHCPQCIETIRSVGYRLIAPVEYDLAADASPEAADQMDLSAARSAPVSTPAPPHSRRYRFVWPALLVIVVLAGFVWLRLTEAPSPSRSLLHKVPFTSLQGVEEAPAFSPDGNQIAFVWTGQQGDNEDIYVKLIDSEALLRLTSNPAPERSPAWSPDGRRIAFLRMTEDTCAVFLIPALGGPERKLADCTAPREATLAWSPDGKWLALPLQPDSQPSPAIFLLSVETGARRQVTFPQQAADLHPAFSPDGKQISFTRFTSERVGDLYVVSIEGGDAQRLTSDNRFILGHAWTPDGRRIVFSSNRAGNRKLWHLPASGGAPEWLASLDTYDPAAPVFSGQRRHLAYVEWFLDYNIWRLDTGGEGAASRVVASTRWDRHPSVAPDGQRIAFTSNRSGTNELWVGDSDGANPVRLTSFNGAYVSTPRWSPDGRRLVFEARAESHADLYVIDAEGGQPRQRTFSTSDDVAPSWSRDGQWMYFGSDRSGHWQVWKLPAAGGDAVQVTRSGGFAAFESPDGRSIYYTKSTTPGIWQQHLDGGEETQVLPALWPNDWGNWTVTEKGIYFVHRVAFDRATLSVYRFATGAITAIAPLPRGFPLGAADLAMSPDGTSMLFTQADRRESDIMFVEALRLVSRPATP